MNRETGWRIIETAGRLARKGNEQAASDLLFQAARYFGEFDPISGQMRIEKSLASFAQKVGEECCAACGINQSGIEAHLEGCSKLRIQQREDNHTKDFGLPGEAG